jgi:magnesium transporter
MHITVFDAEGSREAQPADLPALLTAKDVTLWVDMTGPEPDDLRVMREVFQFHPLAIEDTTNQWQRPKIEEYPNHLFLILDPVATTGDKVDFRELDVFVGTNYLVTVHALAEPVVESARTRVIPPQTTLAMSASYLLYVVLDTTVDSYFPVIDTIGEWLGDVEGVILENPRPEALHTLFRLKQMLADCWRVVWAQHEAMNVVSRRELPLIDHDTLAYHLRDASDHLLRVADAVNIFRDTLTGVMDLYMSAVSNRLTRVVTRLTAFAVVIGLLTVISAFYGMNYTQSWPSFSSPWGVPFVVGLMLAVTGLVLVVLGRLGWF